MMPSCSRLVIAAIYHEAEDLTMLWLQRRKCQAGHYSRETQETTGTGILIPVPVVRHHTIVGRKRIAAHSSLIPTHSAGVQAHG